MKIYSVALNLHDHNTYDGVFHNQRERFTREKHNFSDTDNFIKSYFKILTVFRISRSNRCLLVGPTARYSTAL